MPVETAKLITAHAGTLQDLLIDVSGLNAAATVTITDIPEGGEIRKADGTVLAVGNILTIAELAGLVFAAGTNADAGTQFNFGYDVSFGGMTESGSLDVATIIADPVTYFTATDGVNGTELWRLNVDGTVELVSDIRTGTSSSNPSNFFEFNGELYFRATTDAEGSELHRVKADGTVEMVSDINLSTVGSSPSNFLLPISSATDATSNLSGGGGNDTIYVQANSFITGGTGNDTFVLSSTGNTAQGGANDDIYIVQAASNTLTELMGEGNDTVYSSLADFTLSDNIETLVLIGTNSNGTGNGEANTIIGNGTANTLMGLAGSDFLIGGGGDDMIQGGAGLDVMQGNAGNDTYVYANAGELGDIIQDWIAAEDGFQFSAAAFGFVAGSSLTDGVNFISGNNPTAALGLATFLWDADDTALYFDADGSGAGAAVLVADLQAFTDVTVADFTFV